MKLMHCLLIVFLAYTPLAYSQEIKNKICRTDKCVYYPTNLPKPITSVTIQGDNTSNINNKPINPTLIPPSSIVYKYQDQTGKWNYTDHLPDAKHLVYYIVDEQGRK